MKQASLTLKPTARRTLALSIAVALAFPLAACAPRENGPAAGADAGDFAAVQDGTIVWGKQDEVIALDPATSSLGSSWELLTIVYDRLLGLDDELQPVPSLAESWDEISETEYRFALRTDAAFSNGRPVTADDVVWSLTRSSDPEQGGSLASRIGDIESIVAEDEHTVLLRMKRPNPALLGGLATIGASIMPSVEVEDGSVDLTTEMLGSGSYMVESHQQDKSWTLVSNPHAWSAPQADTLEIRIMPDQNARIAALSDGSIDITTFDSPDAVQLLESTQKVSVKVQDRPDFYLLNLNAREPKLSDPRVRQAISHALDREQIRDIALAGIGSPTGPASVVFPDGLEPALGYDPELAKKLLTEAGAAELEIEIIYSGEPFGAISQVVQQQLDAVGIRSRVSDVEEGVWADRVWGTVPSDMDVTVSWYAAYSAPTHVFGNYVPAISPWAVGFLPEDDTETTERIMTAMTATGEDLPAAIADGATAIEEQATAIPLLTKPVTIAYRADTVQPSIAPVDGLSSPLARVSEFQSARG